MLAGFADRLKTKEHDNLVSQGGEESLELRDPEIFHMLNADDGLTLAKMSKNPRDQLNIHNTVQS
jgi:hypothetical protein